MTEKITLEQVLKLVSFMEAPEGDWKVLTVRGNVHGDVHGDVGGEVWGGVHGDVYGDVRGTVCGEVRGGVNGDVCGKIWGSVDNVLGDVRGTVRGTINGRRWESVETPKEKLERLIQESGDQELIKAFNQQLEGNNG